MNDEKTENIIEDYVNESLELIKFLNQKQYTLADIGLKEKQAFDWSKAGLYLEEKKAKGRRKYNAIEYVWLRLINELREFGLSYDAIRRLKSFLLKPIEWGEMLISIMDGAFENDNEMQLLQNKLLDVFGDEEGKNELKNILSDEEVILIDTMLCLLIYMSIYSKTNSYLLITKEGNTYVSNGEPLSDIMDYSDLLNGPYIAFPLRHILSDFVAREDLMNLEQKQEFISLTDQEIKLLDLLRQGNLVSLSVRFDKDHQISLIETEEDIDINQTRGKLADYIMRNSYQEITYKTQNGKITTMRRKTKHKG